MAGFYSPFSLHHHSPYKSKDLHRAVWFMLKPMAAFLQSPSTGSDYTDSMPYMQKRIEEMEEWSKDVTLFAQGCGGAVLIQTPDYQATAPEPKGFQQTKSMTVIDFNFVAPTFEFTWIAKSLRDVGGEYQMLVDKDRYNVTSFETLRYRMKLSMALGDIGVRYWTEKKAGQELTDSKGEVDDGQQLTDSKGEVDDGQQLTDSEGEVDDGQKPNKITMTDLKGDQLTLTVVGKCVVSYSINEKEEKLKNKRRNPYAIVKAFLDGRSINNAISELSKPYVG